MDHKFSHIMVFPHKFRLARVIRTRGGKEGVLPIAKAIYEAHLKHLQNFRVAVHFFLDVCFTVDKVKIETIGVATPTDVSNDVQLAIAHEMVSNLQWDSSDVRWLEEKIPSFRSTTDFLTSWGGTKLYVVLNAMHHVVETRNFASQALVLDSALVAQAEAEYEATESTIREMMERLMELRKYGVKSSFTKSGFVPSSKNAWVMWDSRDFTRQMGVARKNLVATVALGTDVDQIKDLRLERVRRTNVDAEVIELTFPASFLWMMRKDGELDVLSGIGSLPTREIFRKCGSDLLHQAVRLKLVYHLYDLIVPVAKLATLPSGHTPKIGVINKLREALGLAKKDPVVDLILPRFQLLDDRKGVVEAAEREIEEALVQTQQRAKRRHDVVDFIRPLPRGHRPSPQARQRAWEALGIELGENETYVRAHKRGSGEEITAHEAKRARC